MRRRKKKKRRADEKCIQMEDLYKLYILMYILSISDEPQNVKDVEIY